ncbi:hypothetical protein [Tellurirhabdus bombi]|uniref:hypothetical protein n=1 Tax=Tellurirhabdus bombi TaxID=2907205 RepID=UPI001F372B43|nr:hypothetical protein [Tellurirhabdus bombi]
MKRLVRFLAFLLIIPLVCLLVFSEIIRCFFIESSTDFQPIAPAVFVSRDTPVRQRLFLLDEIKQARKRVNNLWMSPQQGRATVIFCRTLREYEQYCRSGEGAGCSLGTPWGDSWIIINPYGRNPDVLAHEMCHNELYKRLGWLTTQRQIPQWFNEGLALMLDGRFLSSRPDNQPDSLQRFQDYNNQWRRAVRGQQPLALKNLESTQDFFDGGERRVMLAYMTAGREVSRWLILVGRSGLLALTQAVADGEDFSAAYQRLERQARSQKKT